MRHYFYARPGHTAGGPVTLAELKGLLSQSKIGPRSLVCRDGEDQWAAIEEVLRVDEPLGATPVTQPREDKGGLDAVFLSVGQVVSVLGCLASLLGIPWLLFNAGAANRGGGDQPTQPPVAQGFVWVNVLLLVVGFCYSAAMYVVFTRVKRLGE